MEELLQLVFAGPAGTSKALGRFRGHAPEFAAQSPSFSPHVTPAEVEQALWSAIRILGDRRRFKGSKKHGRETPPKELADYWRAVAHQWNADPDSLIDFLSAQLAKSGAADQFLLDARKIAIIPGEGREWVCGACGCRHLHPSAGVCADCTSTVPDEPAAFKAGDDYYAYLALRAGDPFRLHAEELTGQTDRADAQSRQAQFRESSSATAKFRSSMRSICSVSRLRWKQAWTSARYGPF